VGGDVAKVLMNSEDPLKPIVYGAADRARDLGHPFSIGLCGLKELTDEQYEEGRKCWEKAKKQRIE
jgi:hypothetical protein